MLTKDKAQPELTCNKCSKTSATHHCSTHHKSYCCKPGLFCDNCKKFVPVTTTNPTIEAAKFYHECYTQFWCYLCRSPYETNEGHHVCRLKEIKPQHYHANIGVITCEYEEKMINQDTSVLRPVLINVVAEKTRGHLTKMVCSDPRLNILDSEQTETDFVRSDYFNFSALESNYKELSQATSMYSNGQPRSKRYENLLDLKVQYTTSINLFSKLFRTIISAEYRAFSFIVENKDVMHEIMSHLIKQDIRPDVLVQQNEYFLLKIPEFNISFLNLQNYLPYEIHDLIKMYKLPLSYPIFPFQTLNELSLIHI